MGGETKPKKYDWENLRQLYLNSTCATRSDFLRAHGVPNNGYTRSKMVDWEAERAKRREKIQKEVDKNVTKHAIKTETKRQIQQLDLADKLLNSVQVAVDAIVPYKKGAIYQLKLAAEALEKIQKSQERSEGKKADTSLMEALLEAAATPNAVEPPDDLDYDPNTPSGEIVISPEIAAVEAELLGYDDPNANIISLPLPPKITALDELVRSETIIEVVT